MTGKPAARLRFNYRPIFRAFERFLQVEASSALLLVLATAVALLWANSPGAQSYESLWQTRVPLSPGSWLPAHSLRFWINDGLMTVFFLVIGLEIRGELHDGVLSDRKVATLPMVAALGGIVFPALVFITFSSDPLLRRGWAIPTATDIAFAVGVLALLGRRVPRTLRILLLTLAIVDDIGAILIIAWFYSGEFDAVGFVVSLCAIAGVLVFQRAGVRGAAWYLLPGALLWYGFSRAGLHPTLAGVVLGFLTPVKHQTGSGDPPLARVKDALHPWVAFGVMPLFALANAGVALHGIHLATPSVLLLGTAILLGLVAGKPLGITMATALGVRLGWCTLPRGIHWRHIVVLGCLGGVGFTMSIFLASLAFTQGELLAVAKGAVLVGSIVAGGIGVVVGRVMLSLETRP